MKLIIAGGRNLEIPMSRLVQEVRKISPSFVDLTIVSGGARGIDSQGERWARNLMRPVMRFNANWLLGPMAGPIRNRKMAEYADALLLIWDGKSKGSANMKQEMTRLGKPVYEIIL